MNRNMTIESTALGYFVPALHKAKIQQMHAKCVYLPYYEPLTAPEIQRTQSQRVMMACSGCNLLSVDVKSCTSKRHCVG